MKRTTWQQRMGLDETRYYQTSVQVERAHWKALKNHLRYTGIHPSEIVRIVMYRWMVSQGILEADSILDDHGPGGAFEMETRIKGKIATAKYVREIYDRPSYDKEPERPEPCKPEYPEDYDGSQKV